MDSMIVWEFGGGLIENKLFIANFGNLDLFYI
jgi:hypothetical protein